MFDTFVANDTNLVAGTQEGVFFSADKGKSWRAINAGLPRGSYLRALAVSGANLFAGTSKGEVYRLPLSEVSVKKQ